MAAVLVPAELRADKFRVDCLKLGASGCPFVS